MRDCRLKSSFLRFDAIPLKILKERFASEIIEIFGVHVDTLIANEVDLCRRSKGIAEVFDSLDSGRQSQRQSIRRSARV